MINKISKIYNKMISEMDLNDIYELNSIFNSEFTDKSYNMINNYINESIAESDIKLYKIDENDDIIHLSSTNESTDVFYINKGDKFLYFEKGNNNILLLNKKYNNISESFIDIIKKKYKDITGKTIESGREPAYYIKCIQKPNIDIKDIPESEFSLEFLYVAISVVFQTLYDFHEKRFNPPTLINDFRYLILNTNIKDLDDYLISLLVRGSELAYCPNNYPYIDDMLSRYRELCNELKKVDKIKPNFTYIKKYKLPTFYVYSNVISDEN